jgi:hypothetical protein
VQYEHAGVQVYISISQTTPHFDKETLLLEFSRPIHFSGCGFIERVIPHYKSECVEIQGDYRGGRRRCNRNTQKKSSVLVAARTGWIGSKQETL